ncbi:MAG: glycosyl hydrolase family 65 protein [Coriobacteriia bacterium]
MSVWTLSYDRYDPAEEPLREALCTVGNGFFATRGAAPEAEADGTHYPGTYVAGYFNRLTDEIDGKTIENESIVNMPNWLPLTFRIGDGEWFHIDRVTILDYLQELDLRAGVLKRHVRFTDEAGRTTSLTQRRFVHMAHRHLGALETTVVAEDWSGTVTFRSAIDGRVANRGVERYNALAGDHLEPVGCGADPEDGQVVFLQMETNQSHVRVAEAARTRVYMGEKELDVPRETVTDDEYVAHEFSVQVEEGESVTAEKVVALFASRDRAITEPCEEARKHARRCRDFDDLLTFHRLTWDHLWERFGIGLCDEQDEIGRILNAHIFHLLQTVSPNSIDLDVGVPARGLHGEAYRGHIFWDEIFIFPFINYRLPELTRALLQYRFRRLPEARWRAYREGLRGALYPWQSGSNGREESQTWHLNPRSGEWVEDNSHLQRHIDIAIAFNVWSYYEVTGDTEFMAFQGAEMLLEIARFWASLATYNRAEDRYEILGVMGPDEYHDGYPDAGKPGLDNNAYTNVMAVWCLLRALDVLAILPPYRRREIWDLLSLEREELELWEEITRKMKVPFHDGVISQFQGYEDLDEFDWDGYRARYDDIQRLDRILGAEGDTPNRYKVSKQADVLMLFYLLSTDELREIFDRLGYELTDELITNTIFYYLQRTSHGSTLSRVVHSWVLVRHDRERSWQFFAEALKSDIADIQGGTTSEGIHLGAMAGTVDLVQRCYTGLEAREDTLWLNPALPAELGCVEINLRYRGMWLHLTFEHDKVTISSDPEDAGACHVGVNATRYEIQPGETREIAVPS